MNKSGHPPRWLPIRTADFHRYRYRYRYCHRPDLGGSVAARCIPNEQAPRRSSCPACGCEWRECSVASPLRRLPNCGPALTPPQ